MKTLQQLQETLHNYYNQKHLATITDGQMGADYWNQKIEELRREIEERKSENIMDLFS